MEITALQRHVQPADLPLENLAANTQLTDDQKVAELSRQFEAVLLRQILSEAQKPLLDQSSGGGSQLANGVYQDMVTQQLADQISRSGDLHLADSLRQQLIHQTLHPDSQPDAAGTASHKPPAL